MSTILKLAFEELGTKEIPGAAHEPRILHYAKDSGIEGVQDDETAWCSIFVNWICKELDLPRSNKVTARSWVNVGTTVRDPRPGDVVVFWREHINSWKGHVGFFLGYSADLSQVFCLGGNQSNSVSVDAYGAEKVLRFQRIEKAELIGVPKPVLKLGSHGDEVFKLQKFLKLKGYDCGDPDSHFGPKTEIALKLFQADHQLTVDGVYGAQSAGIVETLTVE